MFVSTFRYHPPSTNAVWAGAILTVVLAHAQCRQLRTDDCLTQCGAFVAHSFLHTMRHARTLHSQSLCSTATLFNAAASSLPLFRTWSADTAPPYCTQKFQRFSTDHRPLQSTEQNPRCEFEYGNTLLRPFGRDRTEHHEIYFNGQGPT
jgi:hypothetical protein